MVGPGLTIRLLPVGARGRVPWLWASRGAIPSKAAIKVRPDRVRTYVAMGLMIVVSFIGGLGIGLVGVVAARWCGLVYAYSLQNRPKHILKRATRRGGEARG